MDKLGSRLLGLLPDDDVSGLFVQLEHGARGFARVLLYPGLRVYVSPHAAGESYTHLEFTGEGCEAFGDARLLGFLLDVTADGVRWRFSRLDFAWDHVGFGPDLVNRSAVRGDIRVACRRSAGWRRWFESAEADDDSQDERDRDRSRAGRTCYIGRQSAERMVRVYDKRGYNRLELQLRGRRAAAVGLELVSIDGDKLSAFMLGHLLDFVSFVDRDSDANPSRRRPLSWWRDFIGEAKAAALRLPRLLPKVVEGARTIRRRATRQLAIQAIAFGREYVATELERAGRMLRLEDYAKGKALALAVRQASEELGDDVARHSAWPDPTLLDLARSWGRDSTCPI